MIENRALLTGTRLLAFVLALGIAGAEAATKPPPASAPSSSPAQIFPGTSSKEPISIDADKLVYFDKEQKAIYSGNVVVIQGDTKMTCSVMTVYLDKSPAPSSSPSPAANAQGAARTPRGRRKIPASSGSKPPARSRLSPRRRSPPETVARTTRVRTKSF